VVGPSALIIRPALESELGELIAIDDDAGSLYAEHGLHIELAPDHVFAQAERARWLRAAELGRAFVAADESAQVLGFATLEELDGAAYLDQLAVRARAMRRGIGARLLTHAAEWAHAAGSPTLWLTTYAHLPFNRDFYERHGYRVVPEANCGPEIRHHLEEQRRYLPAPEQRVAMWRAV